MVDQFQTLQITRAQGNTCEKMGRCLLVYLRIRKKTRRESTIFHACVAFMALLAVSGICIVHDV